jgi:hypothetical protein
MLLAIAAQSCDRGAPAGQPAAAAITPAVKVEAVEEAAASDLPYPWYQPEANARTLHEALAAQQELLGAANPGYRRQGNGELCETLRRARLGCDYNTRLSLSLFLAVNDKAPPDGGLDYVGTPQQNRSLDDAVRRNIALFSDGLTKGEVRRQWRR